ncbi:MAG: hypothetical protein NT007_02605 [Candidatus Kapabacteria bacterium]|nr:hypothetical protein [Candidatus Kapabacteria bacterium]
MRLYKNVNSLSFLPVQESPSSSIQGITTCAGMTEKDSFHTVSNTGITFFFHIGNDLSNV